MSGLRLFDLRASSSVQRRLAALNPRQTGFWRANWLGFNDHTSILNKSVLAAFGNRDWRIGCSGRACTWREHRFDFDHQTIWRFCLRFLFVGSVVVFAVFDEISVADKHYKHVPLVAYELVVLFGRWKGVNVHLFQVRMSYGLTRSRQSSIKCGQEKLAALVAGTHELLLNVVSTNEFAQIFVVKKRAEAYLENKKTAIDWAISLIQNSGWDLQ